MLGLKFNYVSKRGHWGPTENKPALALQILVNTGSGNGLLHAGTEPLPEPMLTYDQ